MTFRYDLTQLQNREQLIDFLGINDALFDYVVNFEPSTASSVGTAESAVSILEIPAFFQHKIPKRNPARGFRIVWEPTYLKTDYKILARRLDNFFKHNTKGYPHDRCFGFLGGRNIKENAEGHCGHKNLISVDIEDFFSTITSTRVIDFFEFCGIAPAVAELLSRFVTIQKALPPGLPTSPTIANAICTAMDIELDETAQQYSATYSRYADDISFSSNKTPPPLDEIRASIKRHGFDIAQSKTRISKLGQAHYVTGLSVSDGSQPHVPKKMKRNLRQELYYAGKHGVDGHLHHLGINDPRIIQHEVNRIDGLVKFIAHHEPRHSAKLKVDWTNILQRDGYGPSFSPKNQSRMPFYIFVDEAEFVRPDGERILALAMAVSQHQDQVNEAVMDVLQSTLADLWIAGDREAIAKKGLHYSDATEDLRYTYIKRMQSLPFEGYVAMARLPSSQEYEATYIRLINAMIKRRLMAAESAHARIAFEQNDKVSQNLIREAVISVHTTLRKTNNRHPQQCSVAFVGKPSFGMSVPDFLLGVLGKYLKSTPAQVGKPTPRDVLMFERIRDKFRLILDVDNRIEYGRRHPIAPWSDTKPVVTELTPS